MSLERLKLFLVALSFVIGSTLTYAAEPLTAVEAVRLAERYVTEQGYTKQPANREKLRSETFMKPVGSIDDLLKQRANSIQPKAMGVRPIQWMGGQPGWTVGFYLQAHGDAWWRRVVVVTMKPDGSDPVVQHEWAPREFFQPKPRTP